LRTSLVASQIIGLAVGRYILQVEPLASAPRATLIAVLSPTIQHYLTGDLES
jgi:Tetracyclin repressor-like, C-terminal domain